MDTQRLRSFSHYVTNLRNEDLLSTLNGTRRAVKRLQNMIRAKPILLQILHPCIIRNIRF